MPGIKQKADRLFNPELVAIATAVNNKCLRKGEIRRFSMGGICSSHLERERKKMGSEEKRELCQAQCRSGHRGGECQQRVAPQVIEDRIFCELVTQNTNTQF